MSKKIFSSRKNIFRIKAEERLLAVLALLVVGGLNVLLVLHYMERFTPLQDAYWKLFIKNFHVSGFDPITYYVLSDWHQSYNVFRHPLLAYMLWPFAQLNQGLMWLTGENWAIYIVAVLQTLIGLYSVIFFYRIVREVVGTGRLAAHLLTALFFGFSFIMLATIAPDHFGPSMLLLLLSLYISGKLMQKGRELSIWQTVLYFTLTAGVSLNNGLKVFLAGLFVNGRRAFRWQYALLAVIVPAGLMWYGARLTFDHYVYPSQHARQMERARQNKARKERVKQLKAERAQWDSTLQARGDTLQLRLFRDSLKEMKRSAAQRAKARHVTTGKPIAKGEFSQWTDISTPRGETIVENLFGEPIQLHRDYLLEDQLIRRPVIVHYRWWWCYAIEAVIVLLMLAGLWVGRRTRFLWLVMSYFLMDMLLHIGLGFGINEVYIMAPHFLFAVPIAIAYLMRESMVADRCRKAVTAVVALLALWLWCYNGYLIVDYLLNERQPWV